ncbi:sugar porter family MFS transporter [Streptomyces sp. NPDC054765]
MGNRHTTTDGLAQEVAPAPRTTPRNRGALTTVAGTAALGGLLFGFDTGIISAALLYIREDFGLGTFGQQAVVSILLVGAIVGALTAGQLLDRIGRKKALFALAVVFTLAALSCAAAPSVGLLMIGRFVLGLAVGASSVAVPVYVAEIAPPTSRGRLVSLYQLLVGVGIFVSYLVGYAFSNGGHWRWMLGVAALPSVIMLAGVARLPESPRWLVTRGRDEEARTALARLHAEEDIDRALQEFHSGSEPETKVSYRDLFRPRFRRAVLLGMAVAAANQLVGVNAVVYYAPTLLVKAGLGASASLLSSVGIGIAIVVFTTLAVLCVDKVGRRPLLLSGMATVVASLVFIGCVYLLPERDGVTGPLLVTGLILYIAAFSASLGISIWIINSEIFPTAIRGKAASLGSLTLWVLDLVIALTTLTLFQLLTPQGLFWLFAVFGTVGFVVLYRHLPETKNRSLEDIQESLTAGRRPSGAQDERILS